MAERTIAKRGKTKLEINKAEFQETVSKLESQTNFSSVGDLWKAVEETDWAKNQKVRPLTAPVARIRAIELGIEFKLNSGIKGKRGKTKIEVNKDAFQAIVNQLESENNFDKLEDLWKAVSETDWAKNQKVTASIAKNRAIELGIEFKTISNIVSGKKRGKTKLELDKDEFQEIVNKLESQSNFEKADDLWKAVAETDWAKNQVVRPLTAIVAKIRAEELEIVYETCSTYNNTGKRGRTKLELNKDEFQEIVSNLESKNNFDKLEDLWKAVAETDWAKNQEVRPLTAIVAKVRAEELNIEYKTKSNIGKSGRIKLEVDKDEFQKLVNDLENRYHFNKIDELWKAVEKTDWAKDQGIRPLTAIVAKSRAEELGIQTRIQPRKRKAREDHSEADEKETKIAKSFAMNDVLHMENSGIPRMSNMTMVLIPCGTCPYKLENVEEDTVISWCEKVVTHFARIQQQMTPTALTYFARQFFDINTPDFHVVKSNIQINKIQIYDSNIA